MGCKRTDSPTASGRSSRLCPVGSAHFGVLFSWSSFVSPLSKEGRRLLNLVGILVLVRLPNRRYQARRAEVQNLLLECLSVLGVQDKDACAPHDISLDAPVALLLKPHYGRRFSFQSHPYLIFTHS